MPVGRCLSWTADEVLLIFCPPGPEPLRKASVRSLAGVAARGGRCSGRGRLGGLLGGGGVLEGLGMEGRGAVVERGVGLWR